MFYDKIAKILKERDLNLNQLAINAGFAQTATTRWKSGGMPSIDALIKICKYLNVSADYLLDLEDEPPNIILTDQEKTLLLNYRLCSSERQKIIQETANTGAQNSISEKTLLNSEIAG